MVGVGGVEGLGVLNKGSSHHLRVRPLSQVSVILGLIFVAQGLVPCPLLLSGGMSESDS